MIVLGEISEALLYLCFSLSKGSFLICYPENSFDYYD